MQPDEYETMFRVEQTHWWYRALHRRLLDAGCGTGRVGRELFKRGDLVRADATMKADREGAR